MDDRPNILLIMTDQQRGDCLSIDGHPVLMTPNMDGIAGAGARFRRAYTTCPSCVAARRSLLSGQTPRTHGLVGYADGIEWPAPVTLPQALRDAGYQTGIVGRSMHQHPPRKRYGYESMEIHGWESDYSDWLEAHAPDSGGHFGGGVMHNDYTAHPWGLPEHLHFTNWTVWRALDFLRRRDPSCPFFLTVSFLGPHPPLQPPPFYMERYLRTGGPHPVIGDWARPPANDGLGLDASSAKVSLHGEMLASARAGYYGLINHIDDQIRRLLNPVTGVDRLTNNNTVVLFTSDHGEMLGDHYCWRKSLPYEGSARIPLLIKAPPRFGIRAGTVLDAPVCLEDVMPTLLDLAGVPIPSSVDGVSLLPLMRAAGEQAEAKAAADDDDDATGAAVAAATSDGASTPAAAPMDLDRVAGRDFLHLEHAPIHQTLTDGREKYVWLVASGEEQFFDLQHDPRECRNLASEPRNRERLVLWRRRLIKALAGRPEGFTDGETLIAGRPYGAALPHAGTKHEVKRTLTHH